MQSYPPSLLKDVVISGNSAEVEKTDCFFIELKLQMAIHATRRSKYADEFSAKQY
jgi:hypothetical protein